MNVGQIRIPIDSKLMGTSDRISGKSGKVVSVENGKIQILIDDKLIKIEAGRLSRVKPGDIIQVFFEKDMPAELEGRNFENLKAKLLEMFSLSLPFKSSEGITDILDNFSQHEKIEFARLSSEITEISREILNDILGEESQYAGERTKNGVSVMDADMPYDRRLLEFALRAKSMGKSWSELPQNVKKELVRAFVFYDLKERTVGEHGEKIQSKSAAAVKDGFQQGTRREFIKDDAVADKKAGHFPKNIAENEGYFQSKSNSGTPAYEKAHIKIPSGNAADLRNRPDIPQNRVAGDVHKENNVVSDYRPSSGSEKEYVLKEVSQTLKNVEEHGVETDVKNGGKPYAPLNEPLSPKVNPVRIPDKMILDSYVRVYGNSGDSKLLSDFTGKSAVRLFQVLTDSLSEPVNMRKLFFSEGKGFSTKANGDMQATLKELYRAGWLSDDKKEILNIIRTLPETAGKVTVSSVNLFEANSGLRQDLKDVFHLMRENGVPENDAKKVLTDTVNLLRYFSHEKESGTVLSGRDIMDNILHRSLDITLRGIRAADNDTTQKTFRETVQTSARQAEQTQADKGTSLISLLKKTIVGIFEKTFDYGKNELAESGKKQIETRDTYESSRSVIKNTVVTSAGFEKNAFRESIVDKTESLPENMKAESSFLEEDEPVSRASVQKQAEIRENFVEKYGTAGKEPIAEESKFQRLVNIQTSNYETVYSSVFSLGNQSFRVDFYGHQVSEEKYEKNKMYRVLIETNTQLLGDVLVDTHFSNRMMDIYIYSEPEYAEEFTKHSSFLMKRMKKEGFAVKNIYIRNKPKQTEIIEKKTKYVVNEMKGEFFGFA